MSKTLSPWEVARKIDTLSPVNKPGFEFKTITDEALESVLMKHELYLKGKSGGQLADLSFYDLTNNKIDHSFKNFDYINFTGSKLPINCEFDGVSFKGANLSFTEICNVKFEKCDFKDATANCMKTFSCDFKKCCFNAMECNKSIFENATFSKVDAISTRFVGCDMREIKMSGDFSDSFLSSSILRHASVTKGTDFTSAMFENCDLTGMIANKVNFKFACLEGAEAQNVSFEGSNLRNVRFDKNTNLENANLRDCNLSNAVGYDQVQGKNIKDISFDYSK